MLLLSTMNNQERMKKQKWVKWIRTTNNPRKRVRPIFGIGMTRIETFVGIITYHIYSFHHVDYSDHIFFYVLVITKTVPRSRVCRNYCIVVL